MDTISRKALLSETNATKDQIREGDESFTLIFETFSELAEFFTYNGRSACQNDFSTSIGDRGFYNDDALGLARDASLEVAPGKYAVTFNGWRLT